MQRYIQTDIRGYSPAPGDLAYPDKLLVAAQISASEAGLDETTTDSDSVFEASGTEVSCALYLSPLLNLSSLFTCNNYVCMLRESLSYVFWGFKKSSTLDK